jgi:hypothetical protein
MRDLNIRKVVHQVGEQDVVELFFLRKRGSVHYLKFKFGMPLARQRNH